MVTNGKQKVGYDDLLDWLDNKHPKRSAKVTALGKDVLMAFCAEPKGSFDVDISGNKDTAFEQLVTQLEAFRVERSKKGPSKKEQNRQQAIKKADKQLEKAKETVKAIETGGEKASPIFTYLREQPTTTAFAGAVIFLEETLNPVVSAEGSHEAQVLVLKAKGKAIGKAVQLVATVPADACAPADYFQVLRLRHTYEYRVLCDFAELKADRVALDKALGRVETSCLKQLGVGDQHGLLVELAVDTLVQILPKSADTCRHWMTTQEIMWAPHGMESAHRPATFEQLCAGVGEVAICMPLLKRCDGIARKHTRLYTWDPETLVRKMLAKTVRKHKLLSLLEIVQGVDDLYEALAGLMDTDVIDVRIQKSLRTKFDDMVVGAVAYQAKAQFRQLRMLMALLAQRPGLVCTGYELSDDESAPMDLGFRSADGTELVVEVESVPADPRPDACTYVLNRYAEKMKTVGKKLTENQRLVLVIPDANRLAPQHLEILEAQGDKFWLVMD